MNRQLLLQQALNQMKIKQCEYARIIKVDPSAVSHWMRGTEYFRDERIFQLKYFCDKNIGLVESNKLFAPILREIEG